jgi:hypothetical protein
VSPLREGTDFDHPPRSVSQRLGAILWPSFFRRRGDDGVFRLRRRWTFATSPSGAEHLAQLGYTLGFFMFWVATCASSLT